MSKLATFSFDDGGPSDFQTADLFLRRGLVPTTYIMASLINADEMIYGMPARDICRKYHGIEVGSHTVSHPHLSLASREHTLFELDRSRAILSDVLERPITMFAHPYGSSGPLTEQLLTDCGYTWARRIHRSWQQPTDHRLRMPIDIMFYSETEEQDFDRMLADGQNIHVLCHSWWIVRENLLPLLDDWISRLLAADYTILPNSQYFERTLA